MTQRKSNTYTVIDKEVIITMRERSSIWQCAYKVGKKWQRTSTGERDFNLAKEKAKQIFYKAQSRTEIDCTAVTSSGLDNARISRATRSQLHKNTLSKRLKRDVVLRVACRRTSNRAKEEQ